MPLFHDFRNSNQHLFFVHFHILFLLNMGIEVFIKKNIKKMYVLICNRPTYLQIASRFFITFKKKKTVRIFHEFRNSNHHFFQTLSISENYELWTSSFLLKKSIKKMDAFFGLGGATGNGCPFFLNIFFYEKLETHIS